MHPSVGTWSRFYPGRVAHSALKLMNKRPNSCIVAQLHGRLLEITRVRFRGRGGGGGGGGANMSIEQMHDAPEG